ncbi:MAG: hypothetical protein J6I96_05305 [Oscillospiraceae bacterium]|nr:hypothetical protein [Oscillospiraceae bacterium]
MDKKLKGFQKDNAVFSDDGSRTQVYRKTDGDGEQVVTLVKNVTESGVMVFSDVPIPTLRHGGIILYLRDIVWMLFFAAVYWVGYPILLNRVPQIVYRLTPYGTMAAAAVVFALLILATVKPVSVRRTPVRVRFLQLGGLFSIVLGVYSLGSMIFSRFNDYRSFLRNLVASPLSALLIGWLIVHIAEKKLFKK